MAALGNRPEFILVQIFRSLDLHELLQSIALTNRRFHEIVHTNSILWRHFSMDHQLELSVKDLQNILKHSVAFLENLIP